MERKIIRQVTWMGRQLALVDNASGAFCDGCAFEDGSPLCYGPVGMCSDGNHRIFIPLPGGNEQRGE